MAYPNPEISALHDRLEPFNKLNPPDAYWIESSEGDDSTGGYDYCRECGVARVERLNLYTSGETTHDLMMCDRCGNNDNVPVCEDCGITLAGWLTDYGASQELDYFGSKDADPTPESVHVVSMVLWNLQWSADAEEVASWRDVAEKMVAKLPALEPAQYPQSKEVPWKR